MCKLRGFINKKPLKWFMGMFKAYDVRGLYPDEITIQSAEKLGYAFALFLEEQKQPLTILLGRDARNGSDRLMDSFALGAARKAQVHLLGLCTTPSLYVLTAVKKYGAGVMVTASHNPKEYNGFKFCLKNAKPLGYDTGLKRVEELYNSIIGLPAGNGILKPAQLLEEYETLFYRFFRMEEISKKRVVIDPGNGVGAITAIPLFRKLNIPYSAINLSIDGNFPDRSPNPSDGVDALQQAVIAQNADIGFAFDGDADRLIVVDEKGAIIDSSSVAQLLALHYLDIRRYASVVLDLRLSKGVSEFIYEHHGEVVLSKTGHVNIKRIMRDRNAIMGAELSGHYYHKQIYFVDDALYTALVLLLVLHRSAETISEMVKKLKHYPQVHFDLEVKNQKVSLLRLKEAFSDARMSDMDGLRFEYSDWWGVIRPSNTEPVLRISVEANSERKLLEIKKRITDLL